MKRPTIPTTPSSYDAQNEASFRQAIDSAFTQIFQYIQSPPNVGSPATLASGNNNDFDPGQLTVLRLTPHASNSTLTGISAGRSGRSIDIVNVGSTTLTLAHQSASSTAENRLLSVTGVDVILTANQTAKALYDATTLRWRVTPNDARNAGVVSATLATGATNNYDAGANTAYLRVTSNAAGSTLTGVSGGVSVRQVVITNLANTLTLAHENASSDAANRIVSPTGADVNLDANDNAILQYDGTSTRWRILAYAT